MLRLFATLARFALAVVAGYGLTIALCATFLASLMCGHNAYIPILLTIIAIFALLEVVAASRRRRRATEGRPEDQR
jgi:hypothetical protein